MAANKYAVTQVCVLFTCRTQKRLEKQNNLLTPHHITLVGLNAFKRMESGSYCGPTVLCMGLYSLKVQSYPLLNSGHIQSSTSQKGPEQRCCLLQYIENSESIACSFCSGNGSSPLY